MHVFPKENSILHISQQKYNVLIKLVYVFACIVFNEHEFSTNIKF